MYANKTWFVRSNERHTLKTKKQQQEIWRQCFAAYYMKRLRTPQKVHILLIFSSSTDIDNTYFSSISISIFVLRHHYTLNITVITYDFLYNCKIIWIDFYQIEANLWLCKMWVRDIWQKLKGLENHFLNFTSLLSLTIWYIIKLE